MNINEIDWQQVRLNIDAFERKAKNPELELVIYANNNEELNSCYNEKKVDVSNLDINIITCKYRIKPEPKYQPYKEVKEEWIGKKVEIVSERVKGIITNIKEEAQLISTAGSWYRLERMFQVATWGKNGDENDGKPFGELVK